MKVVSQKQVIPYRCVIYSYICLYLINIKLKTLQKRICREVSEDQADISTSDILLYSLILSIRISVF